MADRLAPVDPKYADRGYLIGYDDVAAWAKLRAAIAYGSVSWLREVIDHEVFPYGVKDRYPR